MNIKNTIRDMRLFKNIIIFFVFSFALWVYPVFCSGQISTKKIVLDNGMVVLISEMPASPKVAIQVYVRVGSVIEGKFLGAGLSHLTEHMLFKGTEKRALGQIAQEVKALGGTINASTGRDFTIYTLDVPAEYFRQAIDIISDMVAHSRFDPDEFRKEKNVILGEMRLRNDNPGVVLNDLAFQTIYTRHPYRHPIIGYKPLFEALTLSDLEEFYHHYYVPNNMILTVAGHVRSSEILPDIKEAFKDFSPRPYVLRNLPVEPRQVAPRMVEREYPTKLTRVMMAFPGVSVDNPHMFALDVLSMLLGQGQSSRLYRDLIEKKRLVNSISAYDFTPKDKGFFSIEFVLEGKGVEKAIAEVRKQIESVKTRGVSSQELEKAKRQVLSDYLFERQTASAVAYDAAINEDFTGDYDFSEKYVDAVRRVSLKDIRSVARKYLKEEMLNTIILRPPRGERKLLRKEENPEKNKITLFRFENGLRVLLREDHTFPLVTMRLSCQGGLRAETPRNNGISRLTAQLWTKGTTGKSSQEIAQSVEEKGARLKGFSGKNSMGLILEVLSQDTAFGLNLMADLIKNPSFPEDQISKVKQRQKAAILAEQDNISRVTSRALLKLLFKTHPYRLDPLGTVRSLDKINRSEIQGFYRKIVVPDNMVLAVYGDINKDRVLSMIRKNLRGLPKEEFTIPVRVEEPPEKMREEVHEMDKEQAMVMFGFQGAPLGSEDETGLEVLTAVLGSSMNSRLFTKIREELGEAYSLGGYYVPGPDMGIIRFYVLTSDEKVERVKEVLKELMIQVQSGKITQEELRRTKVYLKGSQKMSLETNADLALVTTLDELYGLGFDRYEGFEERIDKVSPEDIQRLARQYLSLPKACLEVTRPPQKQEGEKVFSEGQGQGQ